MVRRLAGRVWAVVVYALLGVLWAWGDLEREVRA